MITLILNGNKVQAPSGWHEVTVEMAEKICQWDGKDQITLFNILTGTNYAKVKQSTEIGSVFWNVINFVYFRNVVTNAKLPKILKIDAGHIIPIPKKVGKLTIGQMIYLRQRMEAVQLKLESDLKADPNLTRYTLKDGFLFDSLISIAVACYLQPLYDGQEFDEARAENLDGFIKKMNIVDVWQIGFFLLNQLLNGGGNSTRFLYLKIRTKIVSGLNSLICRR